ncbi:ParA family protein [Paraglaciecola chathamensis]|uniref:ParA family protein n=1 Tax=Paraglaciecola chathamensis TaxID=368405 RepID=UPI0027030BCB|nr:ParA family protein [Paraglaciecola chathamensis]MDO6842082.1 ParA family protein [Paraglaciecola chathamensis]
MKVLGIAAQKGGAGKTTLTVHLAVLAEQEGFNVVIADTDPQRSAIGWHKRRDSEYPVTVALNTKQLPEMIADAGRDGFNLIIIDSAPSHTEDVKDVCGVSDFTLIPSRPAVFDLDAIEATVGLLSKLKAKAGIVLNACPAGRGGESSITYEARQVLAGSYAPVSPFSITNRAALSHALIDGRSVSEFEPTGKANKELKALWNWIKEQL